MDVPYRLLDRDGMNRESVAMSSQIKKYTQSKNPNPKRTGGCTDK